MKAINITIRCGESGNFASERYTITHFTMLEPSTMTFRFKTAQGQLWQSYGNVLDYDHKDSLDALPPCPEK